MTDNNLEQAIPFGLYITSPVINFSALQKHTLNLIQIDIKDKRRKDKVDFVRNLLANLMISTKYNTPIMYSRDRHDWYIYRRYGKCYMKYDIMTEVIDLFIQHGLIYHYKGYYNSMDNIGRLSRFIPTEKFIITMNDFIGVPENIVDLPKDELDEVIQLTKTIKYKSKNGKPKKKSKKILYTNTREIERMRNRLVKYNEWIKNFGVEIKEANIELSDTQLEGIINNLKAGEINSLRIVSKDKNNSSSNSKAYSNSNIGIRVSYPPPTNTPTTTITQPKMTYEVSMCLNYLQLHRVFCGGKFTLGGRFYGAIYQRISKDLRPFILINGEPTIELDYSALHIRMLYHMIGIDYQEDPYLSISDSLEDRRDLKYVMLIAINDKTENSVKYSVAKKCAEDKRDIIPHWKTDMYLQRFKNYHSPISKFISSNKGIELQFQDSQIIDTILQSCMKLNIPALPVHDSILIPKKHSDKARQIMNEEYKKRLGFYPVIK